MIDVLWRSARTHLKPLQIPNRKLNVGIFEEETRALEQTEILVSENSSISYAKEIEEDNGHREGKGKMNIPESQDYYMGEVL
jgi:hypothetical protein